VQVISSVPQRTEFGVEIEALGEGASVEASKRVQCYLRTSVQSDIGGRLASTTWRIVLCEPSLIPLVIGA